MINATPIRGLLNNRELHTRGIVETTFLLIPSLC